MSEGFRHWSAPGFRRLRVTSLSKRERVRQLLAQLDGATSPGDYVAREAISVLAEIVEDLCADVAEVKAR